MSSGKMTCFEVEKKDFIGNSIGANRKKGTHEKSKQRLLPYSSQKAYEDDFLRVLCKDYPQAGISHDEGLENSKCLDSYLKGILLISKNKLSV